MIKQTFWRCRSLLFVALLLGTLILSGCDEAARTGDSTKATSAISSENKNSGDEAEGGSSSSDTDGANAASATDGITSESAADGATTGSETDATSVVSATVSENATVRMEIWTGSSASSWSGISSVDALSAYSGDLFVVVNGNQPDFTAQELSDTTSYESYSELDALGRCGVCVACVGVDLMPTSERTSIGQIKPTGWHTIKYDCVDGLYLYNRCHLLAYELTGENANEQNLITGTRYFNVSGMLPFENMVADYVKDTENHVLYRVTPIFEGNNLVATGVEMEGYSLEDDGDSICFHVFVYNIQPGIEIDYATGESKEAEETTADQGTTEDTATSDTKTSTTADTQESTTADTKNSTTADTKNSTTADSSDTDTTTYIINTNTKKFHKESCSSVADISDHNKSSYTGSKDTLIAQGYSACKRCNP